jgi:flagellar biosynthesis protein FlhB
MADDRTEKPTARRLREARRKGQIARSRDFAHSGTLAAAMLALIMSGGFMMRGLGRAMGNTLSQLHRFPAHDLHADEMGVIAQQGLIALATLCGPVAATALIAAVGLFVMQGGWVFATEALTLNFGKLNPAQGLKRLGFSTGGIETLKMLLLVTVIAILSYQVVQVTLLDAGRYARLSPLDSALEGWNGMERLLKQSIIAMFIMGCADYAVQRWRLMKTLKMTKQEVKDDFKMTEGNPEIKSRIRRIQLTMARKRMLAAVPRATVVVTNPTHYAVALEYRRSEMAAPRVLAKGRGFLAQKIKAIAREHGVPTVENVPLAQSLYKTVEVGDFIPASLFEAVAEVLAYLIRLKQLAL